MDIEKTLTIIAALASGNDPATGRPLPSDHLCQQPDLIRALAVARDVVERAARRERGLQRARLTMPHNTGQSWTNEEDRVLLTRFKTGTGVADLATLHARTPNAIAARLEKLGQSVPTARLEPGQVSAASGTHRRPYDA